MRLRNFTLAAAVALACCSAACGPDASAPANNAAEASNNSNMNGRALAADRTASPTPAASKGGVSPIFVASETQLRSAFDAYESRGEQQQKVGVGEEKSLDVTAQGSHGAETLKLRVLFLPPLEQAKAKGYSFGLVAKQRTPDDRKAFENVSVSNISKRKEQVDFRVFLEQPKDDSAALPSISFELLDKDGHEVKPTTQPTSFESGKDIITAVALAEEGQELVFPLLNAGSPYLTDGMDKLRLVVSIGGAEQTLEFRLK
jgi:hypothetical protein